MPKTRFTCCIAIICAITAIAVCYVHQEIEIVKTSFRISRHNNELAFLLDQHRSLVYNLSRLESPKRIEDSLCVNEIVLCMPTKENTRHFDTVDAYRQEKAGSEYRESFLARIFDRFSAKAEATVVK
jgi:hypothetical protein